GVSEHSINTAKDQLTQINRILANSTEQRQRFESSFKNLIDTIQSGPATLDDYFNLFNEIEAIQTSTYENLNNEFVEQRNTLQTNLTSFTQRLMDAEREAGILVNEMNTLNENLDRANNQYIEGRIQLALLKDRRSRLRRRMEIIKADIDRVTRDLKDAEAEALIRGPRIETGRDSEEILNEIRRTAGMLMGMANVPDEAEEMYENYNHTFKEIQQRIKEVRENRRTVLQEIEKRSRKWQEVTETLLEEVNSRYQSLMSKLQATGETRLINAHDVEEAGLEIYVGFKGAVPQKLDPYTHSGGERSTSIMAFLLALQQNILSPFRAVDEFDLHMDPRNKEAVSSFIVDTMEGTTGQYMAITPSQITFKGQDVHIVMVHKTENVSVPKVVEEE
ncbi:MAG: hypothetical protein NWE89_14695, partial [Candidatus Bathyarchaeota archaeon]|nr:hypothetical protein [Candidatus Bathyarchaeota archaeon]